MSYLPEQAIHSPAFPCNPRPFARRIDELCDGNSGAIQSPEARACLMILLQQSYGQLATVDSYEETVSLMKQISAGD